MRAKTQSRWSLASAGNRAVLAVALGIAAYATTQSVLLFAMIGGLTFLIASLFKPRG
ncbi:MAG TPA: hypothetical protein VFM50_06565 [Nocardioidaceae bacterium]|nr:hypothetical protein [Nocardioidaceae bacterium]